MALGELQRKAAQAIVNVFETGTPLGRYGSVTVIPGDTGHLTYGRSQTTLASGNLALLVRAYCDADGAEFSGPLRDYLDRLRRRDLTLDNDTSFKSALRQAGEDPVMHVVQDSFFDRVYWTPARAHAEADGIEQALGIAVVYDSHVHGSWASVRGMTGGNPRELGEQAWIASYVTTRRRWLAENANPVLHGTVYRMDAFKTLIATNHWDLSLPFTVRGVQIDEATLVGRGGSAEDPQEATLFLTEPTMKGEPVRKLQLALKRSGIQLDVDGEFGPQTDAAVRLFQSHRNLEVDGVVGHATRAALES